MKDAEIPEIQPGIPNNAVSIYGQDDAIDDFPVLKAFQQYIDAEQTKARKRLVLLGIFFGSLTLVIIAVFIALLLASNNRNQLLNDRLVEFAMKDREQRAAASQMSAADQAAISSLNAKLESMQQSLVKEQQRAAEAEQARAEAAAKAIAEATEKAKAEAAARKAEEANKATSPSSQELEITKLKLQLEAEKQKAALLKEQQHQAELEAYRRKHYPELYEVPKKQSVKSKVTAKKKPVAIEDDEDDVEMDDIDDTLKSLEDLENGKAVKYFDTDDEEEETTKTKKSLKKQEAPEVKENKSASDDYSIPVDIKGNAGKIRLPAE